MKNFLVNNEPILRAIEICRKGNFTMCVLFQDEITVAQRQELLWFLGQFVTLRPIDSADLALEYCAPDAHSLVKSFKEDQVDFSFLNDFKRENYLVIPDTLTESCSNLLKIAHEKLEYEPRDTDIVVRVARCIALMSKNDSIRLEHLAEAIQYRSFNRNLLVKNRGSWTAEQLYEIVAMMSWKEEYAQSRYTKPYEQLGDLAQAEWEGIMWGWQDAVTRFKQLLNLDDTLKLEIRTVPTKSDWYICYVEGERMPLRYNAPNDFWVGMDGKTYSSKTTMWINN